MAEVTNESFQELISTTKETNKILREDMALESKPDPGKFIKEEASNLLIADLNRRSSKELLKTEQKERESDKKTVVTNKEQRVKLIEEQEKTTKALLMMASNQDMQSKIDTMLASANAEDEEKRTRTFKKMFSSIKEGFQGFSKTNQATQAFLKKMPGSGLLMRTLKGLGFLGLIAVLNDPRIKKLGVNLVKNVLPALATVIDNVILPFFNFVFEMFTGEHPALQAVKNAIKKYGPDFLKDEADGISSTMGLLAGALSVALIFAPFKTLGLMTAAGVFVFPKLYKGIKFLAKWFSGMEKGVDKVSKAAKVTSTAAGAAGAVAGAAGAYKGPLGKPGTFDKKTKLMFGADGKPTTVVQGSKGADAAAKAARSAAGSPSKLASALSKYPRLKKITTRIPILGGIISAAMIAPMLLDPTISENQKIEALGGVLGGAFGAMSGAKLGALLGAMGPLAPFTSPLGAIGGGLLGYFAGEKIGMEAAKYLLGGAPDVKKVSNAITDQKMIAAARAEGMKGGDGPENVFDLSKASKPPTGPKFETEFARKRRLIMEAEAGGLPRSNGGAGQGMRPVNTMYERPPPVSPVLNAPTSVVDNSQTSYSTNTKSLVIPDNVIATLNAVR